MTEYRYSVHNYMWYLGFWLMKIRGRVSQAHWLDLTHVINYVQKSMYCTYIVCCILSGSTRSLAGSRREACLLGRSRVSCFLIFPSSTDPFYFLSFLSLSLSLSLSLLRRGEKSTDIKPTSKQASRPAGRQAGMPAGRVRATVT